MEPINYTNCPCCNAGLIAPALTAKDYTVSGENFAIWQCSQCTVRFTQNVPGPAAIARYYQSAGYISHTDTREGFVNSMYHRVRKRTLQQKKKLVEKVTGITQGNLLDIGAGTGAFLHAMHQGGWNVTGLEPDEATRQKAFELYNLPLQNSEQLFILPPASFDAITLWHVLEHVHELHQYAEQVKQLLTPKGSLFIAVPNYASLDAAIYKEYWAAYDVPRHLYHFSPHSMKLFLQKHGLTITAYKPMWFDSFYVSMLSEQYKTGSSHHLNALLTGLLSNGRALFNKEKCSSLIYVVTR